MAHQVRDEELNVRYDSTSLMSRPKLLALIGAIAAEWGYLEADLTFLYAIFIGTAINSRPPDIPHGPHPLGLQIYEVLDNTHKRIELLLASNDQLKKELKETLVPEIIRAAKRRNTILHAVWGVSDVYPNAMLCIPSFKKWLVYEESDFLEAIELIISTSRTIRKFQIDVRQFLDGK